MGHRGKVNSKAAAKRRENDCVLLFELLAILICVALMNKLSIRR
jgi:hypothetical protein